MNESQSKISRNTSSSHFSLPKIQKLTTAPKYLEVKGYKNYKYKSYMMDLMKSDKKLQKLLPFHLQNLTKTPRKRYELNDSTKQELLHFSKLDNIFTEGDLDVMKQATVTQGAMNIQAMYKKTLKSYEQDSQNTRRADESQLCDEITMNNSMISNIIEHQKQLTINPRVIRQAKKEIYKEMNTIKEFKVLVKNTQQYIDIYDIKETGKNPFIYQFILRESYLSFTELSGVVQDRILLAFDINPHNEQEKVYYSQFRLFKQIVISQHFKEQTLINFFIKFFNPQNQPAITMQDFRSILIVILQNSENMDQLVKYILKNIQLSQYVEDNQIKDLFGIFKSKILDPINLIYLLLNNN
ncbi:unnamed protein product (macronuclear) [Paramecium tetraurelia]|uniref:EF-hand domain-containing protein n=1 Tax=Paramecium tetraurelia TaxID=5888 RepID=A0BJU2_PARTE|nr:uncharacterized protein GSPATT00029438001 [Paramecium tetraurelia]CAK58809.1 unnamed protein product [Paramecium tetraurelia]|eukprot:XP_001426207.1 hypothetical protein (macronuclear) [Paramecium tetraurelia strain d4-2]